MNLFTLGLLLWLIVVATMDFKYRKVNNTVFLFGLVSVLACLFMDHQRDWGMGVLAAVLVFFILLPLYALRGMGGGDVKFGVVIALFWGMSLNLLMVMGIASIISMCHAVLYINIKNKNVSIYFLSFFKCVGFENMYIKKIMSENMGGTIPFAGYVAISTIFWMLCKSPP